MVLLVSSTVLCRDNFTKLSSDVIAERLSSCLMGILMKIQVMF